MIPNTEKGVRIVVGVANIAYVLGWTLTKEKLIDLLTLLDHKTSENQKYTDPHQLVNKSIAEYKDTESAAIIREVFPWLQPNVDSSLLKETK